MAVLGLRFCARAFSSCGKWGPLFITVRRPLTVAASLVAEHRLQTRRLSNCDSRAQLLCGMWDPPRPGLEPVCPALAGRFSTTAPPGKPLMFIFYLFFFFLVIHFIHISVYMSVPISQFIPPPPPPPRHFPRLVSIRFFSLLLCLDFYSAKRFICTIS